ncbi:unnamed protein product [Mytilus edulis]|uniref:C3H1-type domain-containing protein n=1 Tax=Mytilus edulis TaxID=6550 RepID=A0A8S3PP05_MYTED|nr:unnamed protein product [Mytilus edulis]
MPKQRARSKRRAAPSDLTDRDLVIDPVVLPTVETTTSNTSRGRKRVRNIGPTPPTAPVMNIASTTAQPTADEIAAAMITQLKGAGLHLTDSSGVRLSDDRLSSVCGMRSSATQEAVSGTDNQTESQHTLPSSSSNTVHYSLVPPVTSDLSVAGYFKASSPTTQEDQTLGIDNSSIGQTASYLIRNTLPLGFNVSEKIRKDIMSDSYVDFVTISPNFNEDEDEDVLFKSKAVKISTYAKPKQLFSIHQWTEAFDIYMSIYYVNHPEHILSLIKYAYNVRAMSKQFGFNMAKSYDETFRKVRRVMKFDWAVVNDDLWRTAFYDNFNRSNTNTGNNASNNKHVKQSGGPPFQRRVQQQSSQFPPGYCWTYCRTGGCSSDNCKHKHQCVQCDKKHATVSCKEWLTTHKSTNTNKSK